MSGILLFVAFAFFAFAQAASTRNGAQSAADAAALAASQDGRRELVAGLVASGSTPDQWPDWLDGTRLVGDGAEGAASGLAAQNRSHLVGFTPVEVNGAPGFKVEVETDYTVGASIIPGIGNRKARASATAVLSPRCQLGDKPVDDDVDLECDGEADVVIDFKDFDPADLPDTADLFSVHLTE